MKCVICATYQLKNSGEYYHYYNGHFNDSNDAVTISQGMALCVEHVSDYPPRE